MAKIINNQTLLWGATAAKRAIKNSPQACNTAPTTMMFLRQKKLLSHTEINWVKAPNNCGRPVTHPICVMLACRKMAKALKKLSLVAVMAEEARASRWESFNVPLSQLRLKLRRFSGLSVFCAVDFI